MILIRAGQALGLLFLIGPVSDLVSSSGSIAQKTAIAVVLVVFVALYLAVWPPARPLVQRGVNATRVAVLVLAGLAGLALALGAPGSFALLFWYVVAAAGLALPAREALAVTGVTAAAVAAGLAVTGSDSSTVAAYTISIVAVGAITASLGTTTRANRKLREAREELARLAVAEERSRIARDLHDLLGHTLSLIALKTELATKLVENDPKRAQTELHEVLSVTRQALGEVREAVHGYGRRAVADELEGARSALTAAGIECRVAASTDDLPDEIENAIAWAVREATTNVVRHSGARTCEIRLSTGDGRVALQVDDDGARTAGGSRNGAGLAGLAERARRLHGMLEAGGRAEGGFRVQLTLPLDAP
jgi:two-component system, NarL family, sensor histidine kinase DesK